MKHNIFNLPLGGISDFNTLLKSVPESQATRTKPKIINTSNGYSTLIDRRIILPSQESGYFFDKKTVEKNHLRDSVRYMSLLPQQSSGVHHVRELYISVDSGFSDIHNKVIKPLTTISKSNDILNSGYTISPVDHFEFYSLHLTGKFENIKKIFPEVVNIIIPGSIIIPETYAYKNPRFGLEGVLPFMEFPTHETHYKALVFNIDTKKFRFFGHTESIHNSITLFSKVDLNQLFY